MTPETILDIAKQQGVTITPARAQELAEVIGAAVATVNKIALPFEAEPEAFHNTLEEVAR